MADSVDDRMVAVVIEILETDGYDAVQLREVARRARTSLATIYKRYATREDLIMAALEVWLDEFRYSEVSPHGRAEGESLHAALMALFRVIFEPWERHPGMLTAYFHARSSPRGQQLFQRGLDIVAPAGLQLMADVDDGFVADLNNVVSCVVYGLLGRFVAGEIETTDILPTLDRTVYWLTAGYESTKRIAVE
ncbi:TetR/AcrR family transcriptional regulator [Mycolicibacterium flavescens]|uniref:TetR family transcriptional regulator n=1 Tax=Mycolicibacterium flavescens TaxID=1776 RepID=A0A1E3RGP4_MYCFV|nr:TetR/AcrR family transcriptional regulator [Mycolicibacterium flavescens]MCV7280360.1 TetR/AcrR family transcriptional regulator [Mycolicibacterium flavescens]ODQ88999.1 TetR family transcriptional regulator [Mycolicibacterium flavescens]